MDVITFQELRDSGLTKRAIAAQVDSGQLIRLMRGRYVREPLATGPDARQRRHELLSRLVGDAVLGLESAALVHDLPVDTIPDKVHTLVAGRGRSWERQHRIIMSTRLSGDAIEQVGIHRVTGVARTLVDIARWRGLDAGLIPWEAARWRARVAGRVEDLDMALDGTLAELDNCRGIEQARRARALASAWSQSPMETRSLTIMRRAGIPLPVQQYEVRGVQGVLLGVADFAWPELGLLGEYDGLDKYELLAGDGESPLDVLRREKRRQEAMEAEGHRFVRWGGEEVARPIRLVAKLRTAMATAGRRAG